MVYDDIQAVTFDAAGTLIHLAEPVGASYSRVARAHGVTVSPKALQSSFARIWQCTPPPFSPEHVDPDPDEKSWWRRFVHEVFADAGASFATGPEDSFRDFFEALYLHFESPGAWEADPDAAEVLSSVARSRRCALLSNFDARLRRILRDLGLFDYFECHFISCEIGIAKPDIRLFERVAEELSLPPSAILHVGDDPICDWKGATSAGFQIFRTGRQGSPLREVLRQLSLA